MDAGHGATMDSQSHSPERPVHTSLRDRANAGGGLRILLAERRATAHSELGRRLQDHGHEVLARVTSAQGAIDYAGLLTPDVVLFSPSLEDAPGLTVAITVARKQPGVAAVVLTDHPAAADPAARPNWGSVALLSASAKPDDMHAELWRAVERAREAAGYDLFDATDLTADASSDITVENPDVDIVIRAVPESVTQSADDPSAAATTEEQTIAAMVDALYPPPSTLVPTSPAPLAKAHAAQQRDDEIVARATAGLVERAHLSRVTAMRLMEQEAADTGQSVADVARAMLGRVSDETTGDDIAAAA